MASVDLALGTVQFGTAYGVAGRGVPVPPEEVRAILKRAFELGVRMLDTAPVYGDIEERLVGLAGDRGFSIVSKIAPLPPQVTAEAAAQQVEEGVSRSRDRLGSQLATLLFHRSQDLLGPVGQAAWAAAERAARVVGVRLGASCYSPAEAIEMRERFAVSVVQLPGNALDQRLVRNRAADRLEGVEIHVRSAFLQGLLLMPPERAVARVPSAAGALAAWSRWCAERSLAPLAAALGIVKSLPGVRYCVVGVDSLDHLEQIVAAWQSVDFLSAAALACDDAEVIDPRKWVVT